MIYGCAFVGCPDLMVSLLALVVANNDTSGQPDASYITPDAVTSRTKLDMSSARHSCPHILPSLKDNQKNKKKWNL